MTKRSVPINSELLSTEMKLFDTRGRQWAQNNVENGPRLLFYVILNS